MQLCKVRTESKRVLREPKIIHILSNGNQVNSIAGKKIPANNPIYQVIEKGAANVNNRDDRVDFRNWCYG